MTRLGRFNILTDEHLTKTHDYSRTWQERLWSWPWRPWQRLGHRIVPNETIYIGSTTLGGEKDLLVMHPVVYVRLEEEMSRQGGGVYGLAFPDPDLDRAIDAINTLLIQEADRGLC